MKNTSSKQFTSSLPPEIVPSVPNDPSYDAEIDRLREERAERVRHLGGTPTIASIAGIHLADPDARIVVSGLDRR